MPDAAANGSEIEQFTLVNTLSPPLMAAVIAAVVILSLYVYRKSWGLRPTLWLTLGLIRIATLALLIAALLEPVVTVQETLTQQRRLPVLLDISESMSMKDQRKQTVDLFDAAVALGFVDQSTPDEQTVGNLTPRQRRDIDSATRLDLTTQFLTGSATTTMETIGEATEVSYHTFGDRTQMLSSNATLLPDDVGEVTASDQQSSIVGSLEAVAASEERPPAGIVVFSDGIDNNSSQRDEVTLRDLGLKGIPVYTVPVGLTEPDDVSIRNIVMQEVAYSGDRVPVRIQLQSKGFEKRTVRLSVHLNGRRVSYRNIRLDDGLQFEDIDFRVDVYEKGAAQINVSIEPFDDEISVENNSVSRSIRIVNEKINVLYIEGNARWEFRYLRAILKRDPRIDATFIASNAGPEIARNSSEHLDRFPDSKEAAFQYDLIVLGDVDAAFFSDEELGLLEELIRDRGASLLMLCGPMHSPGSYSGTPVETMLPVLFDAESPWEEIPESVFPVLTPEGSSSQVMTLENDTETNNRIWSRVAPLDHLPPLQGTRPGATVLATLSDGGAQAKRYPLVAWQRYGSGKCMTVATDRLWRLRFKTGDKYHWRVWSQCIQFMTLSRLMGEHRRIRLETDRVIYPTGSQCRLHAHVLDDNFTPVVQPGFDVVVSSVDEDGLRESIRLTPNQSQPGLYEGYFAPTRPGRYRLESNESDQPLSNTTEFQVVTVNEELNDPNVRRDYLERIARLTGGRCLSLSDFGQLTDLLNREPYSKTVRTDRTLWDNGWFAFLLVGLVGMEWILRRRNDLP